jgi:hypothetical protein
MAARETIRPIGQLDNGECLFSPDEWAAMCDRLGGAEDVVRDVFGSVSFTCGHCGQANGPQYVTWAGPESGRPWSAAAHNFCPSCRWSRHTLWGTRSRPPCGGMMEPRDRGEFVEHRCTGCGFRMTMPAEALGTDEDIRLVVAMNRGLVQYDGQGDGAGS